MKPSNLIFGLFALAFMLAIASHWRTENTIRPNSYRKEKVEFPGEMAPYREAVESSKMDYVQVNARRARNTKLWESKLRGKPYLPKGVKYPTDVDGRPLVLLAQINFSEVPDLAGYPKTGILQFFVSDGYSSKHVWGKEQYDESPFDLKEYFKSLQSQKYFRVVYYPDVVEDADKLQRNVPEFPDASLPVWEEARLTFAKKSEYVNPYDYRFENFLGVDAYTFFERYGDKERVVANQYIQFSNNYDLGKIGGYSYFVQDDPRKRVSSQEDWLLLFQLDSGVIEGGGEVLWGDNGVGNFHITRKALANLDFSEVMYYWDNH